MKYLVLITCLIAACNPVKQVLKDPLKLEEVAQEVVRRGYCVSDTVTETVVKDSIVYRDSIIKKVERIPCKDFDTTIGRARIRVSSGVLFYSAKDSIVYRTKTVSNTVVDRSREKVLSQDIGKLNEALSNERAKLVELKAEFKGYKMDSRIDRAKLWLLIVAIGIFAFRKQILSLWRFFI